MALATQQENAPTPVYLISHNLAEPDIQKGVISLTVPTWHRKAALQLNPTAYDSYKDSRKGDLAQKRSQEIPSPANQRISKGAQKFQSLFKCQITNCFTDVVPLHVSA